MNNSNIGKIYLIPSFLNEETLYTIPPYVLDAVKNCQVFFVENERSARRYLKKLWKEMVIDDYEWFAIDKTEASVINNFKQALSNKKNIGIISEAGCPGVADPGQLLVAKAQQMGAIVQPLVGPSSILLALMASGMNGQQFKFAGYLPIDTTQRVKMLKELETESLKKNCTQIFIETPYRNNQLIETVCKTLQGSTLFCIARDITGPNESIQTKTVDQWKKAVPDIHKRPAIFLLLAVNNRF
jgi:16S rRNA (cytidine1402-2'-O)-methyltransferase